MVRKGREISLYPIYFNKGNHDMYTPQKIISKNLKTEYSINLPTHLCSPTKLCKTICYARYGHMALPVSRRKQNYVSTYLKGNDITQLIQECLFLSYVRLNGCGDLLRGHLSNISLLAKSCPNTVFYGMTRKPEIANALNNKLPNLKLLLSVDSSTPKNILQSYTGKICFGPRRACDTVPDDDRIITVFPLHIHGRVINIPEHPLDCPATRHKISGCHECKRCWNW